MTEFFRLTMRPAGARRSKSYLVKRAGKGTFREVAKDGAGLGTETTNVIHLLVVGDAPVKLAPYHSCLKYGTLEKGLSGDCAACNESRGAWRGGEG